MRMNKLIKMLIDRILYRDWRKLPLSKVRVFRVVRGELKKAEPGKFATGDAYIIDDGMQIFIWLGKSCTVDERFVSALASAQLDLERKGKPTITTIEEGSEIPAFLNLFGGKITITAEDEKGLLKPVIVEKPTEVRMYQVSGESYEKVKFSSVPAKKDLLNSNDVFVIDAFDTVYVWIGKNSSGMERYRGSMLAERFDRDRSEQADVVVLNEGEEPEEFWHIFEG